jgi:hypothetical protein
MRRDAVRGGRAVLPSPKIKARLIRRALPAFLERARRLLRLAEAGGQGPDPDAALPQIEELRRTCAAFLRPHR